VVIVICCCCKLKERCHRSLLLLMLRKELGVATTSRCEQHKVQHLQEDTKTRYVFYIFSLHLRFLYIFSLGLGLWDLCFACFQSSSTLGLCFDGNFDMFARAIVVGAIVAWACWSDCVCWSDCCLSLLERLLLEHKIDHICSSAITLFL
jgi:hypothetical protein